MPHEPEAPRERPRDDDGSAGSAAVHPVGDVTRLLRSWNHGDEEADTRLLEMVYDTLRGMAAARMGVGRADVTLQPTSLVHEALMRLLGSDVDYKDRLHFFAIASLKMRAVLVDYARANMAAKRGAGALMVTLSYADRDAVAGPTVEYQVLALHQALERLASSDPRASRVVELSYFGGLSQDEIAHVIEVSVPTVARDLRFARAWLKRELVGPSAPGLDGAGP